MHSFEQSYKDLNKEQKEAVDAIEGPVIVIAGPGTGKTTILTLRIANILQKTDTAPDSILALTFTESGAGAMRRKLTEIIGTAAYKVNIHTFHGFAERIIEEYPDYFARIIGSRLITDVEQISLIEKLLKNKKIKILKPYGDPNYYVKTILSEIHLLKRENISPSGLIKSLKEDAKETMRKAKNKEESKAELERLNKRDEKNAELAIIYSKYEKALRDEKFYDFDDMLLELIRAMEEVPLFKMLLQEKYQYILADEHQDANSAQNRILELLADFHDNPNLFIVGDDKQAIYRFQGASLENFMYFSKKYTGAKTIELAHNYRSFQTIIDAAHTLISKNPSFNKEERKKLIALQYGGKPIFIDEFKTKKEELEYLPLLVSRLLEKGEKIQEIAILYRENKEAYDIAKSLDKYGIRYRIESDHDILDDPLIVKIVTLCRAVNDPSDNEVLAKTLLLPEFNLDSAVILELFKLSSKRNRALHSVIHDLQSKIVSIEGFSAGDKRVDQVIAVYNKILDWSHQSQVIQFNDFYHLIINKSGILEGVIRSKNSLEKLAILESFYDRAIKAAQTKKTFYLSDFIKYVDVIFEHGIMAKRGLAEHIDGVRLMTAHKAKGLEFNCVILVNAVDGVWGNRRSRNHFEIPIIEKSRDRGSIEDERRLFYVALTRARNMVSLSYSLFADDRARVPSQFISEIDPSLISFAKPSFPEDMKPVEERAKKVIKESDLSILNKELITAKFNSQPLSVTHLNNFLLCPWRYFFVNLIRIPENKNRAQIYGTAIHNTLKAFFDAYRDGRNLSKKEIINILAHNLDLEVLDKSDRQEMFTKGKKAIISYLEYYKGKWNNNFITEYGLKISGKDIRESGIPDLTGKLDKVELLNEHDVLVIDYKTGAPKSRNEIMGKTKGADGNYWRQLVFYKLLLDYDKKYNFKFGEIDFIEPNKQGIHKKERFEITDEDVKSLLDDIARMSQSVVNLDFVKNICDDKNCQYCRLGTMLFE